MAKPPRSIDKMIEDCEAEEVAATRQSEGGRNLALFRKVQAQTARDIKKELVAGKHLPDTPDPVRPKKKLAMKAKARARARGRSI